MEPKIALKVDDKDNVATIFANGITDGTEVEIRDKKGNVDSVNVIGDIPARISKKANMYIYTIWKQEEVGETYRRNHEYYISRIYETGRKSRK